jgi:hypothetical protein
VSVAVVVGNPKLRSRTWQAAHLVAEKLTGGPADLTDADYAESAALDSWLELSRPQRKASLPG